MPDEKTTGPFGCSRCSARWGGDRTCHCSVCHRTFGSLDAFDLHMRPHPDDPDGRKIHLDPAIDTVTLDSGRVERFARNTRGYWSIASRLDQAQAAFRR